MTGGFGETAASRPTQSSSFSNNNGSNNNSGDYVNFECSICLDLAYDPVITLCGHLFCWPCIYKWLHMHSRSNECPICKAYIEEGKLVPLYGRGIKSSSIHCANIPKRPAGRRPENSPTQEHRPGFVQHNGSGYIGGFGPAISASFGNFTFSFGGFIPSIFNVQMHTLNYGGYHALQRDHRHEVSPLLIIGLIFLFALLWE